MYSEDVVARAYEKNGIYSVRSAYRVPKDEQLSVVNNYEANISSSSTSGHWWKHMWKLKVQAKVRISGGERLTIFLPAKKELDSSTTCVA